MSPWLHRSQGGWSKFVLKCRWHERMLGGHNAAMHDDDNDVEVDTQLSTCAFCFWEVVFRKVL